MDEPVEFIYRFLFFIHNAGLRFYLRQNAGLYRHVIHFFPYLQFPNFLLMLVLLRLLTVVPSIFLPVVDRPKRIKNLNQIVFKTARNTIKHAHVLNP